ncbi:MAG: alpha/beta hydrolase family protein [Alkalispirochaeta sp.]
MNDQPRETPLSPNRAHRALFADIRPRLTFDPAADLEAWRRELAGALSSVIGTLPVPVALEPTWFPAERSEHATIQRVEFSVELELRAVGWLVTPPDRAAVPSPRPTMICLQGHSSGGHISLGRTIFPEDPSALAEDHDYALQAVAHGYNAFVLEQRAFGEREDGRSLADRKHFNPENPHTDERCRHLSMVALLLGRTLLGERVHDVKCAVSLIEPLPQVDPGRVGIMGNSGGGTASYYAAALDDRIAAVMPGCSVAPYAESIGAIDHCSDNYLPGAYVHFDMPDIAGLIAPRPLVLVSGEQDPIFPIEATRAAAEHIQHIYDSAGAPGCLRHHVGPGGHRFYRDAWTDFVEATGWSAAGPS